MYHPYSLQCIVHVFILSYYSVYTSKPPVQSYYHDNQSYTLIPPPQDGRHKLWIPILLSNDLNRAGWTALVKMSASCSAE